MDDKTFLLKRPLCLLEAHLYFTHISSPFEEVSQLHLVPVVASQLSALTLFAPRILHETDHGRLDIIMLGASQNKGCLYGLAKTVGIKVPPKDKVSGVEGVVREKGYVDFSSDVKPPYHFKRSHFFEPGIRKRDPLPVSLIMSPSNIQGPSSHHVALVTSTSLQRKAQLGAVEKERVMDEGEEEVFLGGKTLRCPKVLGELGR